MEGSVKDVFVMSEQFNDLTRYYNCRRTAHKQYYNNHQHYLEYSEDYRKNNQLAILERRINYRNDCKALTLEHYSNGAMDCAYCGEKNINFLNVDHINDGGCKQREDLNRRAGMWEYLAVQFRKTGVWPQGYQILCANDNRIKMIETYKFVIRNMTPIKKIYEILQDSCVICGFNNKMALQIDHTNNNGFAEMRIFGGKTWAYYKHVLDVIEREIASLGHCKSYQILCANHNQEKLILAYKEKVMCHQIYLKINRRMNS